MRHRPLGAASRILALILAAFVSGVCLSSTYPTHDLETVALSELVARLETQVTRALVA